MQQYTAASAPSVGLSLITPTLLTPKFVFLKVPKTLVNILSNCDSVSVLIWASAAGWLVSLVLVCGQGILTLPEAMETWMEGMKVGWAEYTYHVLIWQNTWSLFSSRVEPCR